MAGLISGGIFDPIDISALRQKRREGLLGLAIQGARTPQERLGGTLGATVGDLLGTAVGGDTAAIRQAKAMKEVQRKLGATGLAPGKDPEYFRVASGLLEQAGFPDLAQQTLLQEQEYNLKTLPFKQFNFTKERAAEADADDARDYEFKVNRAEVSDEQWTAQQEAVQDNADRNFKLQRLQFERLQNNDAAERASKEEIRGIDTAVQKAMSANKVSPDMPEHDQIQRLVNQKSAILEQPFLTPASERRLDHINKRLNDLGVAPDPEKMVATNVALADGEHVMGRVRHDGTLEIQDEQGEWIRAPRDARMYGTSLQGTEDETGLTPKDLREYREFSTMMPVLKQYHQRLREGLESGQFVGGTSGNLVRILNSFRSQVTQVTGLLGKPDIDLSIDKHREKLQGAADMGSQVQSALINLAYLSAKMTKPGDRVVNEDFNNELNALGVNTSDPAIIAKRAAEMMDSIFTRYEAMSQLMGKTPVYQRESPNQQPPRVQQPPQRQGGNPSASGPILPGGNNENPLGLEFK